MATTPLAADVDVEARLRRSLTADESQWMDDMIEEASLLVTTYCGRAFDPESIPDEVRVVTSRVVARGVTSPRADSATTVRDQADLWQREITYATDATSGGLWLTKSDKAMLDPWSMYGKAFSVDMA